MEYLGKVRRLWKTEHIVYVLRKLPQEAQAPITERHLQGQGQDKTQSKGAAGIRFNHG